MAPQRVKRLSDLRDGQKIAYVAGGAPPVRGFATKGKVYCYMKSESGGMTLSLWERDFESGRVLGSVPGPCPTCAPFDGVARGKDGEWRLCRLCAGGWI